MIAVINESGVYNLAADRIATKLRQEGHLILRSNRADFWTLKCEKAYLSVIFTYDLANTVHDINLLRSRNIEVEVGGPAATALPEFIVENTGLQPFQGLDERWEHIEGDFQATFTSRGCPRACEFCLVHRLEGRRMVEYSHFPVPSGRNPFVLDNNILATTWEHQQLVVQALKHVRNLDLNSGFDDRIFISDPERYWMLYNELKMEAWRLAYDGPAQKDPIAACARFLRGKGVDYRHIIVFCLVGGPGMSFEESVERLQYLLDLETSPYPMRYRPLDTIHRNHVPPGWRKGQMEKIFAYFGNPFVWRTCSWDDFNKDYVQPVEVAKEQLRMVV